MRRVGLGYKENGLNFHLYDSMLRVVIFFGYKLRVRRYYHNKSSYEYTNSIGFNHDRWFIGVTI